MIDEPLRFSSNKVALAWAHDFLKTHPISGRTSSRVVQQLIDSMKQRGWIGSPIVVVIQGDGKYILDGHHRCYAARKAKIQLPYRVIDIAELRNFGYDTIEQVVQAYAEAGVNRIHLS